MKLDLKAWNKGAFRDINKTKESIILCLRELDKRNEQSGLDQESKKNKSKLSAELNSLCFKQEALEKYKARTKWLGQDMNTKFFSQDYKMKKNKEFV